MSAFDDDFKRLEQHYERLFREHGDTPAAVQQRDVETQERRLRELIRIDDLTDMSILDFGCGSGHLLSVLKSEIGYRGEYTGYDLSQPHLESASKKFPDAQFIRRDILSDGIDINYDYGVVSGVFNNKISDNELFYRDVLHKLFDSCSRGIAFNMLSTYVDYFDDGLFYARPEDVFSFCKKELSPLVTLRHDYRVRVGVIPFEFTVYVYK